MSPFRKEGAFVLLAPGASTKAGRILRSLTQPQLADELGISGTRLVAIEGGVTPHPDERQRLEQALPLLKILGALAASAERGRPR